MGFIRKLFGNREAQQSAKTESVIVVSGLPRSGTSMMMKMLEAGGLAVYVDNQRVADDDNPQGYYEFERVKQLDKGDIQWVKDARGQVVKVISALLEHLPPENEYRVLFMHRHINEILASQQKMLTRRDEKSGDISDEEMADLYQKHLTAIDEWLKTQANFTVLNVDYNQLLANPEPQTRTVNQFLGGTLDEEKMVAVVNPDLYRNRV